ncbi:MAG TPA: hypothetical protein PLV05_07725 [Verrucomicrobiota bacterium]|nr:hypothetical protein [Verrucomicrobiota bacterium]HRR65663.1 hypothetical protein [Candidatus Paceibacterota bacterium]HOF71929.1 hypothetical protein [Verrucomicrobiota bacterium]HPC52976.1 hypothetical protein [Verrucomicrobiota bacterium]HPI66194.1 hypothetical protein [Verrucomicrobiota bacterium]
MRASIKRLMRFWRIPAVLVMVTLWVAAGSHCLLAALPGLEFLSCCQHAESERSPAHAEEDCAGDGCSTIESGCYRLEKPQSLPLKPLLASAVVGDAVPGDARPDGAAFLNLRSSSPPELLRAWQFSQRTAQPPRAPSRVS